LKGNGKIVLDTNSVIAYRAAIPEICDIIESANILFLPAPVFGELLYGAINSNNPKKNEIIVKEFLSQCIFVSIDETITSRYAFIRLKLKKSGHPIPENDIWIAATSLELKVPILTNDSHFNHVTGLKVINWEK